MYGPHYLHLIRYWKVITAEVAVKTGNNERSAPFVATRRALVRREAKGGFAKRAGKDYYSLAMVDTGHEEPTRQFGVFELDICRGELRKHGVRIRLQQQPAEILRLLVERPGEIISRADIQKRLWPGETYLAFDNAINSSIRKIREALGDTAENPRFIETLSRRGYRFIAPVTSRSSPATVSNGIGSPGPSIHKPVDRSEPSRRPSWMIAPEAGRRVIRVLFVAAVLAALLSAVTWFVKREPVLNVSGVSPVTKFPGHARNPSLSPDGRQVAFSWDGGDGRHIYVTLLGEQHPLRLTNDAAEDIYPAWSPNGQDIAFIRKRTDSIGDIVLISSLGGPERILHRIQFNFDLVLAGRLLAWSPDGQWLCFSSELAQMLRHDMFLLSIESGAVKQMFPNKPSGGEGDASPAFSPDGHWFAFARFSGPWNSDLMLQRLSPTLEPLGSPLVVSNTGGYATTPVWLADSKTIVFLAHDGKAVMQARIGHAGRLVYASSARLEGLTHSKSGMRFIASAQVGDFDIRSLPLKGLNAAGEAKSLVRSSAAEEMPNFSPDGRLLSFTSNRSGAAEVWLADANGQNARQLTHLGAYIVGDPPQWSPDSQFVIFHARLPSEPQIYRSQVATGVTRQITRAIPGFVGPSVSANGKTIYAFRQLPSNQLYRIDPVTGAAVHLWPGITPKEIPERTLLLYAKLEQRGISCALSKATRSGIRRLV